ncbi:MAG: hypothetical protein IIC50_25095 [Planctomycetes bacterium]|nr:hypothetical protein [Planctomycetota bacterium]
MGDNETKRREDAFTKALNSHGYGFQYAVPRLVEHLGTFDGFAWDAEVSEFPVEVQGADTRIDFILRSKSRDQGHLVLADGGPDHPRWVAAVCPNCHKRVHYGKDGADFNRGIVDLISRLEPDDLGVPKTLKKAQAPSVMLPYS